MTEITMIPLSKLSESDDNIRRVNGKEAIAGLAQSIRALGLLQSLVVHDAGKGKFAVIAGGRRLRALRALAKTGDMEKNAPIPCRVIAGDDDARSLSLAENVVRSNLAPWEELEAFAGFIDKGEGPEAIAARFGVSAQHVARRLKLARLSPRLIEALKRGDATLDQLAALAVVDDHAVQERAFFDAPEWARSPERLHAQVTEAHVAETDKLACFVGVEAYCDGGGAVVSDLFAADGEQCRYLSDRDLLIRLAEAKLEPLSEAVRSEGWNWVAIAIDGFAWTQFPERIRERRRELNEEERAEQNRLLAALDQSQDEAEIERLETALDALAGTQWLAEEVALAGAIITLTQAGEAKVERGLVRSEELKALKALRRKHALLLHGEADSAENTEPAAPPRPYLPAKLVDELLAHKSLALRAELAAAPDLALRLVVFTMALAFIGQHGVSCLGLQLETPDIERSITRADATVPAQFEAEAQAWRERLPADSEQVWDFIETAETETLLDLLAVAVAEGVDLRLGAHPRPARERLNQRLVRAAKVDMRKYWSPTPQSYFDHVRKEVVIDAIREEKPALDRAQLEKCSKAELISRAKRVFKGSAWLPGPLRCGDAAAAAIAAE